MDQMPSNEEILAEVTGNQQSSGSTGEQSEASGQTPISEYEYSANGKTIKEPLETILKRASQGYNYAQHMQDLKARSQEVDQRYNRALELETKYGEIDKYAQDNPAWNDHLHKTWESRFDITGQGQQDQLNGGQQQGAVPSQFLQEFNEMKAFVENIKAEKADQAYEASLSKVKQAYPEVDFGQTDPETGRTLEQQVLDYAQQNNIGRFEPAFKAFYSDRLIEMARSQAKEQLAGDLQKRSKAGLLGTSQAPTRSKGEWEYPANYKNMSSDQLHNWIVDKFAN